MTRKLVSCGTCWRELFHQINSNSVERMKRSTYSQNQSLKVSKLKSHLLIRENYLEDRFVIRFATYVANLINGEMQLDINVAYPIKKLPKDFQNRFTGIKTRSNPANATYEIHADYLSSLYERYWWSGTYFDENKKTLLDVQDAILEAIHNEDTPRGYELTVSACMEVMKWGFGANTSAYRANMEWVKNLGNKIIPTLRMGRNALVGNRPNFDVFINNKSSQEYTPRMNAGWTKYYALALPKFIIYDGRVGAAFGFLVRRFLESLNPKPSCVPDSLSFQWSQGKSTKLRNPSLNEFAFPQLKHYGKYAMREWAIVNVWANWILDEARNMANAEWVSGHDGMRKLEASLFMLGYDLNIRNNPHVEGNHL